MKSKSNPFKYVQDQSHNYSSARPISLVQIGLRNVFPEHLPCLPEYKPGTKGSYRKSIERPLAHVLYCTGNRFLKLNEYL